jgi:hypothetical protein
VDILHHCFGFSDLKLGAVGLSPPTVVPL